MATAIELLPPGGTLVLEPGDYHGLVIPVSASGSPDQRKTLEAMKGARITGQYLT
ncbi:hypothetical protein P4S72_29665 [Vibrio sp. PP-XX7]